MTGKANVEDPKKAVKSIVKFGDDPLTVMAKQVGLKPAELKKILKATIIRPIKADEASGTAAREATDEELTVFLMVANKYHLDPDKKSSAIVPIVSTDGWNKLMTTHPKYKNHRYNYAEKLVTFSGARPCPEWIECVIIREDGSEVVVREYLDECYRSLKFVNPWQTHTKRMLRHKAKIQGAREALGFSGIYDKDEAERIVEGKDIELAAEISYKSGVPMPREKAAISSGVVIDEQKGPDTFEEGPPPGYDEDRIESNGQEDDQINTEEDTAPAEVVTAELVGTKHPYAPDPNAPKGQLDGALIAAENKEKAVDDLKKRVAGMGNTDTTKKKALAGFAQEFFNILKLDMGANMAMVKDQLMKYTGKESFFDLSDVEAKTAYDMYMIHGPKDSPAK
jgi:hypothetical protein